MKNQFLFLNVLIFYVIFYSISYAQDSIIYVTPDDTLDLTLILDEPLIELPSNIPVNENSIYLYADFNNVKDESIPIYLINNSDKDFNYKGDQRPLLQQEYKVTDSIWQRSQAFYFGWCGAGYLYTAKLKSKGFTIFHKPFPSDGVEKIVRYVFYGTEVLPSNNGFGNVDFDEVEKARYDDIALDRNDENFLVNIIKGKIIPFSDEAQNNYLISKAMMALRDNYPDKATIVFEEIARDSTNKFYKQAIRDLKVIRKRNNSK